MCFLRPKCRHSSQHHRVFSRSVCCALHQLPQGMCQSVLYSLSLALCVVKSLVDIYRVIIFSWFSGIFCVEHLFILARCEFVLRQHSTSMRVCALPTMPALFLFCFSILGYKQLYLYGFDAGSLHLHWRQGSFV
jgi:hypothetical protein